MDYARPRKCRTRLETVDGELFLRRRTGSVAAATFLGFWLTVWTGGCVVLVRMLLREPSLEHAFFAVPFLVAWVFAFCALGRMAFGVEHVRIGPEGLEYRSTALVPLGRRSVPLAEVRGVTHFEKVVDTENGAVEHGIKVETSGRPVRFGRGLGRAERLWLGEEVCRHLRVLIRDRPVEHRPDAGEKDSAPVEVLRPERTAPGPPSDSSIRSHADWDGPAFERRGTFSLVALGGITFVCLFWNGIVGVFVLQLVKHFEWPLFFFLMPFEAIGLGMVLGCLAVLTAPFRVERWSIGADEVAARDSVLGLGRTRRVEAADLGRVELRKNAGVSPNAVAATDVDTPYSLGLVGRDGRDLLTIARLTEGEARWLGGELCRAFKGSLKGPVTPPSEGPTPMYDRWLDR